MEKNKQIEKAFKQIDVVCHDLLIGGLVFKKSEQVIKEALIEARKTHVMDLFNKGLNDGEIARLLGYSKCTIVKITCDALREKMHPKIEN